MIVACLFKSYNLVEVALPWGSVVSLLSFSIPSIIFVNVYSFVFFSVIFIPVICSVLYIIFLFIRVLLTGVFWFTYWHPVSFKPLLFLWNLLHGLESSPVWQCLVHCSWRIVAIFSLKLFVIRFVISLSIYFIDSNCISYLIFCNYKSARTFSFAKFYIIFFLEFLYRGNLVRTFKEYMDFFLKFENWSSSSLLLRCCLQNNRFYFYTFIPCLLHRHFCASYTFPDLRSIYLWKCFFNKFHWITVTRI